MGNQCGKLQANEIANENERGPEVRQKYYKRA